MPSIRFSPFADRVTPGSVFGGLPGDFTGGISTNLFLLKSNFRVVSTRKLEMRIAYVAEP